jgi:hypothetical protein
MSGNKILSHRSDECLDSEIAILSTSSSLISSPVVAELPCAGRFVGGHLLSKL